MQVLEMKSRVIRMLAWGRSTAGVAVTNVDEQPIRGELCSVDQLDQRAKTIAATHQLATGHSADKLLPRLADNERILIDTYELISAAAEKKRRIAPAAEWLLDNFYLIEEQIRSIRRLLPPSYSGELPRLANSVWAHYPRVYAIALELISHTDGQVDAARLNGFITSYQSVVPLKLGELWALPLMFRLALIENLRRVAVRIAIGRSDRDTAASWAERMIETVEQSPTDLVLVLADMARANLPLSGAFLAELTRHLQGQNPNFAFASSWLEHRLADQGMTIEQLVTAEGQSQAADHISVGNSITSLRYLAVNDWRKFVAEQSLVEETLSGDPAGVYADMAFATRNRYRQAVEAIAKRSNASEYDIAHRAIQLSQAEISSGANQRKSHVGYFLVDRGRPALERFVGMRFTASVVIEKFRRSYPLAIYIGCVLLIAAAATSAFWLGSDWGSNRILLRGLLFLPLLMCALQLGIGVSNWLASILMSPQPLPRMDFQNGIPDEDRTLIVVPSMLSNAAGIVRALEALEIRYLSNRDACLHFALLTDFEDAQKETLPGDAELVRQVSEGIDQLNQKYEADRSDVFYLFHRNRLWNAHESVWMGYERKRGKLADLNATLRGALNRFSTVVGIVSSLQSVRYVITLDADTQLPRNAARDLIGAMAHPLNRPVYDSFRRRVVDGYTILQPRVGVNLPSARRSWFVRIFGGEVGVDPYTRVVSDLYQDMFEEGSFIGKGIYDVDSFEQRCGNFPENAILSHDLLESCYCRSALLTDVVLYEDFPASYAADISRRHRWIRGDWQIAAWLLPQVRSFSNRRIGNPISSLSWWKIFDNLRRSLLPVSLLAMLLLAWIAGSSTLATTATAFVLAVITIPSILGAMYQFAMKPVELPLGMHCTGSMIATGRPIAQCLLTLVFLPYEAYISLDAILRTIVRVNWTKKNLMEWKTSSDAERSANADLLGFFRSMWIASVVSLFALIWLAVFHPTLLLIAGPVAVMWLVSPFVAWWLSQLIAPPTVRLSDKQKLFLRRSARKTWRYFETFVTKEENYLPPDNVKFDNSLIVASRTSPTNIGMAFLADLAAYDFGYCSAARLLERTQNTFGTFNNMERYRGHFFNWYDTRTLAPLPPKYVSTVDSGNLAAHMLVLGSGLRCMVDSPVMPQHLFNGLQDTLGALLDESKGSDRVSEEGPIQRLNGNISRSIERQIEELELRKVTISSAASLLPVLIERSADLQNELAARDDLSWWVGAFTQTCVDQLNDLKMLAAWAFLPAPAKEFWTSNATEQSAALSDLRLRLSQLDTAPTLRSVATILDSMLPIIDRVRRGLSHSSDSPAKAQLDQSMAWLGQLQESLELSSQFAASRIQNIESTADRCQEIADMDFDFLYDKSRELYVIGYNVSDNRLDTGFYDLLASEARLASFMLIAQGHVGQEHWFALGRLLTCTGGEPALLSWSGSMFEYLMPLLVMPTYENTLLDQTYKAVVGRQINYGRQRGVPWGISESGYNAVDLNSNYQYRAFGVPGLGLKRGLAEDLVIAPYATALGLMVAPEAACRNLERLASEHRESGYGFYEAVDYTPSRLPPGMSCIVVRQLMAHHAGMSLLSFSYVLHDKPMQRRFLSDPMFRAAELLLHERVPKTTAPVFPHAAEASVTRSETAEEAGTMRVFNNPNTTVPEVHLLSNGNYHIAISTAGGGYSRWRDLAVTRWREDPTRDCWGTFFYVRDVESGSLWSTAMHPVSKATKSYEAIFTLARAEFRRKDDQIESHTEVSVSSEDDLELRRVTLTNRSERVRTIEITTYAEVVLASQAQDESHPAFSNLFVQTEIDLQKEAIFCTRRPRSAEEHPPWLIHMMTTGGTTVGEASFETDRMKFIGRGRNLASPRVFDPNETLSNSQGATLDPIVSIRHTLQLQPGESVRVDIVTGVAETRLGVAAMAEKYNDPSLADRVFDLAWSRGPIMLQQLNASQLDAQAYGRLAGSIIYASALRRSKASVLIRNRRGQSGLWGYGISGDLPIVLIRIRDHEKIELVRQAVQAHAYWRMKGLAVDLVIWNEDDSVYRQTLQDSIMDVVAASTEAALVDRPGGIFVRRGEQMSEEDRYLLQTVARVVLLDDAGTLIEQVELRSRSDIPIAPLRITKRIVEIKATPVLHERELAYFNGLGGFSQDGREYITILKPGDATPAPWVNVIANKHIGTVVSESGSAYTWAENSHEYRLTPWSNDPVSDTCGEALYVRDEETGQFWSPSPLPKRGANTYVARHGFGYSIFDHEEDGIVTELCIYVSIDHAVKFARLKITNKSGRPRQLSITGYWEWVLGELRGKSLMHVVTEVDPVTGALFARNSYSPEFAHKVAFVDCSESMRTFTGNRTEFLGRNGSITNPAAMHRARLSNRTGAGLDPCAAIQTQITLEEQQEKIVVFTLGAANNEIDARRLVQQSKGEGNAQRELEGVWHYWSQTLGTVHVETPDASVNFMANGWLVYQTLACRMWARTGFYQSGGAFGFRDQLQDAMSLIHAEPALVREHIKLAASRQFREGDVQHWWHPPVGRGVRTQFSDDYLWLAVAVCRYVQMTGDTGLLDEQIPFLTSRQLQPDEEANYDLPHVSEDVSSIYEHATRAIDHGLRFGVHGLPLMGCGDWNDGMNLVGRHGKGESVWLGFFLYDLLNQFSKLARQRNDLETADRYTIEAGRLRGNIEEHGWDGQWYRRAYFDDGTPLGSAQNAECQIDSLSQSWSVLSGAGTRERSVQAMESVNRRLVRRDAKLIQLLDPPFDKSDLNPGYIKGYVPGVRENGGQYTHGAIWTVMAYAAMGSTERAWELYSMINPIAHGNSSTAIAKYRVEPYVLAADVYGVEPHLGRGGWTWYTGSSGWMYRLITESLLGLHLDVDKLRFNPHPPNNWPGYKIHYRYHQSFYHIAISNHVDSNANAAGDKAIIKRLSIDGVDQAEHFVPLINDHLHHNVEIEMS